jgi:two-component system cell cycle sensor histidine kinase/response regulator CckA
LQAPPARGPTRTTERNLSTAISHYDRDRILPQLRRVFWLGAIALLAVGLTFAFFSWLNSRSSTWVNSSQRVGRLARESRSLALDRESAIRGYLLSGQKSSLAPELSARDALNRKLDSLILMTQDNPSQLDRARAIRAAVKRWERGWATPVLAAGSNSTARAIAGQEAAGKELLDSIRAAFDSFLAGHQRIYRRGVTVQRALQRFSLAAVTIEILLLLGVLAWLSRRSLTQARVLIDQQEQLEAQAADLQQQAMVLEEQAVELEEQTDEATRALAEVAATNESLEATIKKLETAEHVATNAHSAHEETQAVLEFVLNSSPVGVSLFDSNLRLVRVNASMAMMTGVSADQIVGRTIDDIVSDDIAKVLQPGLRGVLSTGEPITNLPLAGTSRVDPMRERNFIASLFPVRLPGRARGVGAVLLETTQYRQLEEQLLQAQKMEAVGRLAGGVAHDFNNMLTAIMSYSELLLADMPAESPQRADMMEIVKAAEKATGLTRKLLAFSRQQVLRPSTVDLNATVEGLRKMINRLVSKNVTVSCQLAPNLWTVTADATEIERVIMNLVLNSRDAMPEGGKLIVETSNVEIDDQYASTHADTRPGKYVMIAVTDTGAGMTREVKDKLFEPFFTTKEKGKGTGLGLPSVYGIVKQSGGFVWVYSELGRGTTIKVYLPRAEDAPASSTRTPRHDRRVGEEMILLVEDDEEVRQVAARILRSSGYRVLEAANGADALRLCESEEGQVDLIVTDIVMPEMGGSELAERVRKTQPDVRILFTSGYTEDAAVRQSFLDPGEAFLEKPFTPAVLTRKTRELLDLGTQAAQT